MYQHYALSSYALSCALWLSTADCEASLAREAALQAELDREMRWQAPTRTRTRTRLSPSPSLPPVPLCPCRSASPLCASFPLPCLCLVSPTLSDSL